MITRLRLENFRRHQTTDITIGADEQIIAVGGRNGAGKSSLLESITFALFGQGRHGPRQLDTLVRRGAEIEGMEVEIEFSIGEDTWRVVRRRDNGTASAVLFANDQPMVEGTRAVTDAVTQLLGMDAAGFRLAAVAQQKELDALLRLDRGSRVRAISRLLRLDAVAKARDAARGEHRRVADIVDALPVPGELADLAAELRAAEASLAAAAAAEAECRAELADLDRELVATADVEQRYHDASRNLAAADAAATSAAAEVERLKGSLAGVKVPEMPEQPVRTTDDIRQENLDVDRRIANAEAQKQLVNQRQVIEAEVDSVNLRMVAIEQELAGRTGMSVTAAVTEAETQEEACRVAHQSAVEAANAARATLVAAQTTAAQLRTRVDAMEALGATCDSCGQDIADDHRHTVIDDARRSYTEAADAEQRAASDVTRAGEAATAAEKAYQDAASRRRQCEHDIEVVANLGGEKVELERRLAVYNEQLGRLPKTVVDVNELYTRQGELTLEEAAARSYEQACAQVAAAEQRQVELTAAIAEAEQRLADVSVAVAGAAIDPALTTAWFRRSEVAGEHRTKLERLGELTAATARHKERVAAGHRDLQRATEAESKRNEYQAQGMVAGLAARVLTEVEQRLGSNVRPALAATTSLILRQMSSERFTDIRLGADFTPTVLDGNDYRPLSELSGGEQDLVALAFRLAVAEVVVERSGGGVGFLILDEVFGSQDPTRRDSILESLRGLRERYGQIWCISHVGGLEDAADRVIDITLDEDGLATAS